MAVAACLAIVFAITARQDADELRDRSAADAEVAAALAAPGAQVVDLAPADGGIGAAVVVAEGRQPLLVTTLDEAPTGRTYQVWAIPGDGAPRSIGLFGGGEDDDVVRLPGDALTGANTVAVTLEPEGGSEGPTTAPFLVGDLEA
jgi:anti-sigma-K factor RskA